MADNTTLNSGTGGDVIATDDISGVKYQRVKIVLGADGINSGDVSSSNAMPVSDNGSSLTIDGSVSVSNFPATQPVSGTVTANAGTGSFTVAQTTAANLNATVTGTVTIQDGGNSITVDNGGTFAVQAAQSGNYTVRTQDGSGNALASSTSAPVGTEQALIVRNVPSGTQTISGTITANAGTGTMNVSVQNASIPVTDNGESLTVDGTVAATQSGTWNVGLNAGSNAIGSITNTSFAATQATAASLNATVVGTGTFAVQAAQSGTWTLGANSGVDIGDVTINNADGGPVPVKIGDGTNYLVVDTLHNDGESNTENHLDVASKVMLYNGTTWDRMRGDTTNGLDVDVTRVSGSVTVAQATAANLNATVTGTVSATQSGSWNVGLNAGSNAIGSITNTSFAVTQATAANLNATIGNANSAPVPVIITNTGRTELRFYAVAAAAGTTTTETAITLTRSSGTSATTTGTSFVVTSGKRFKITQLIFATRGNATATIQSTTFNFRLNTAGAVTTTSTPVILSVRSATPATASAWDRVVVTLPGDGIEIPGDGTLQFGITAAATYTTNAPTWDVTIIGYEY